MRLPELEWVSVDTETSGLHPDDGARVACVALAWPGGKLALPFDQGTRDKLPTVQLELGSEEPNLDEADWHHLLAWLARRKLVFHHAKYDLTMLEAGTRHWPGRRLVEALWWDTMVAQRELDPTEPAGLDATCERLGLGRKTGLDEIKRWLKRNKYPAGRYDLAPWEVVEPYVTADAEMTAELYTHQRRRFVKGDADLARMARELLVTRTLTLVEARGVGFDSEASLRAAEKLEQRAAEIEAKMPFSCDVNSAKRYFFDGEGLPADRYTDKGAPSLDEEQVRKWVGEGVQWAAEYAAVSKARRAVSMYYRGYPEKVGVDGRLRTSYKQTWVKSGRMSVERVQLQAMPKKDKGFEDVPDVRTLLRSRDGYGLWNLDLSQAELRVAAKYSKCDTMLAMLAEGADLHGVTCERVLHATRDDPLWKEKRDIAKRLTFGSIFQVGAETFQATLSKLADIQLPIQECAELVGQWRRAYPEFGVAYRKAERKAARDGWVWVLPKTRYQMRSYFGERDWAHTAWNRMVQGSLAEFFKLWMVDIERRHPGLMLLTVHDSVLLEIPESEGDEIAATIAENGASMATKVFGIEMKVDSDRWQ